jgi:hypothetical protein
MSAPLPSGPRPPVTAELKRLLFRLILTVTLVDVVAISLYYGLRIRSAPPRTQALFTGAWTVVTLVVVVVSLQKIRAARRRRLT